MVGEYSYRLGRALGNSSRSKLVELPRETEVGSAVQSNRVLASASRRKNS
jgi:hypothetical protein